MPAGGAAAGACERPASGSCVHPPHALLSGEDNVPSVNSCRCWAFCISASMPGESSLGLQLLLMRAKSFVRASSCMFLHTICASTEPSSAPARHTLVSIPRARRSRSFSPKFHRTPARDSDSRDDLPHLKEGVANSPSEFDEWIVTTAVIAFPLIGGVED